MRVVSKIDEAGHFVEDVLLSDGQEAPAGTVASRPPEGFYRPKWDGARGAWAEGKPASEILAAAKAAKEAELRDSANAWYMATLRGFEVAVIVHKIDRGRALGPEEQAIRDQMSAAYTKLRTLVGQARASTTVGEVRGVAWS